MKLLTKIMFATLIIGMSLLPVLVFAHGKGGHLHQRLERQQQRIENGIDSGALTHKEAKKLRREQRKIHRMAREFSADRALTKSERRKIRKKLNRASDRISAFKHNDRNRQNNRHYSYSYPDRLQDNSERPWKSWIWKDYDSCRSGSNISWY